MLLNSLVTFFFLSHIFLACIHLVSENENPDLLQLFESSV